jgi:hypothetical protein
MVRVASAALAGNAAAGAAPAAPGGAVATVAAPERENALHSVGTGTTLAGNGRGPGGKGKSARKGRPRVGRASNGAEPTQPPSELARPDNSVLPTESITSNGAPGDSVWDVEVADATGQVLIAWRRMRMRDAGALPHSGPWQLPLVGSYLERAAAELGLGSGLHVQVTREDTLTVDVSAPGPAAAGCSLVSSADQDHPADARWLTALGAARPANQGEAMACAAALSACTGLGSAPEGLAVSSSQIAGMDWVLLAGGDARIACSVLEVTAAGPAAFAVMTGSLTPAT